MGNEANTNSNNNNKGKATRIIVTLIILTGIGLFLNFFVFAKPKIMYNGLTEDLLKTYATIKIENHSIGEYVFNHNEFSITNNNKNKTAINLILIENESSKKYNNEIIIQPYGYAIIKVEFYKILVSNGDTLNYNGKVIAKL